MILDKLDCSIVVLYATPYRTAMLQVSKWLERHERHRPADSVCQKCTAQHWYMLTEHDGVLFDTVLEHFA